jgi:hypothetical protein
MEGIKGVAGVNQGNAVLARSELDLSAHLPTQNTNDYSFVQVHIAKV